MRIAVPAEAQDERRVAVTPEVAQRLIEDRHALLVETGLGNKAGFTDADYRDVGATVVDDPFEQADVVLVVGPPEPRLAARVPRGSALVGFLDPFSSDELVRVLAKRNITSFSMEAIPRTTLAQSMDALSSQATAAGYHAVLIAAAATPRIFPMLTTAAGTVPPVKALILGAGVAGLQAIATAKRLGAVVSAYDIRPEVKEQIESLGARFVAAPMDESVASSSGYAKEVADETQRRQQLTLAPNVADSDVVVTTAQVPGRAAPLLVSREMVESMRPGSVIVDVAAPTGGNCELTRPGDTIVHHGVTIFGPTDLASRVAVDASQMYARNITAFLARITGEDAELSFDWEDPILKEACITHEGQITHPVTRRRLGMDGET